MTPYLWYGSSDSRGSFKNNQVEQDRNALAQGGGGRGGAKASGAYNNRGRDLIDTYVEDNEILAKVPVEELPDEMQQMSIEERLAHLKKMQARRDELKQQIQALSEERRKFLATEMERRGESEDDTLGGVMRAMVNEQLQSAGFETKKK